MSFFDINNILVTVWGYNICFLELLGFISGFLAIFLANRENIYTFWIGILNCICYFEIFWQQHRYKHLRNCMLEFSQRTKAEFEQQAKNNNITS